MPVYFGNVMVKDIFGELKTKLAESGLWTNVSSLDTDGCWESNARPGLYIVLRDGTTQTVAANHNLVIGIAETYTPGQPGAAGTFGNLITNPYHFASTTIQVNTYDVMYWLYVDTTCIILATVADPRVSSTITNLAYLGLPVLYDDAEPDNTANCLAIAAQAPSSTTVKLLRNRARQTNANYTAYSFSTQVPTVPGWGDKYHAFPVAIGVSPEGLRGEFRHLLSMPLQNVLNLDTLIVGGQQYRAFVTHSYGNNSFPTRCHLLPATI